MAVKNTPDVELRCIIVQQLKSTDRKKTEPN